MKEEIKVDIDLEKLRELYLEDLSREVVYGNKKQTRVRHPGKWKRLSSCVNVLNEEIKINDKNVWVWSDQHFSHKNIIKFSERPFDNVHQMNEYLIANHNDYVKEEDVCIWVGDVGFGGDGHINGLLDKCNGYKILVVGNHDFKGKNLRKLNFDEIHLIYGLAVDGINLVFTHYPMYNIPYPFINIHGHLHVFPTPYTDNLLHINVNCEIQEYKPRNLNDIVKISKMRLISYNM